MQINQLSRINQQIFLETLANKIINVSFNLYEYINYTDKERLNDCWWSLDRDYFIFFGENKKEIIGWHFILSKFNGRTDNKLSYLEKY